MLKRGTPKAVLWRPAEVSISAVAERAASLKSGPADFGRFASGFHPASVAGGSGGRARSNLFRVDLGLADESNTFFDGQARSANIAEQFSLGLNIQLFLRDHVTRDLAAHHYRGRIDIAFDHRVVAQIEHAVGSDVTLEFSVECEFA